MKYTHGILVVNRPDLLELAVRSVECLWPDAFILDNSPEGRIGTERAWPIPVVRPSVPLTFPQSINFLYRLAREKGADVFGYQHNDAEAGEYGAAEYFKAVEEAFGSGRKWAAVFTHYDIISAYEMRAFAAIGEWDADFPQPNYTIDVDWFHRARLLGYELIESGVAVVHHNGASSTIKSDAHRRRLNDVKFAMNETYYRCKWGGPPGAEEFPSPWNR